MQRVICHSSLLGVLVLAAAGCSTAPKTTAERTDLKAEAAQALAKAQASDPTLRPFIQDAAGYAVFPTVGKGGLVVGGAYGKGVVYERGTPVAYCDLSQASVGAQVGGQSYSEIICFETPQALANFRSGEFTMSAQATAVVLKSGAAANAKYKDSVVAFTMDAAGLMAEASIGGQKFSIAPMTTDEPVPAGGRMEP